MQQQQQQLFNPKSHIQNNVVRNSVKRRRHRAASSHFTKSNVNQLFYMRATAADHTHLSIRIEEYTYIYTLL